MTASASNLNPFSIAQGLPVQDVLPELCAVLAQNPTTDHPASAILVAPPGAGKTTSVPPVLAAAAWRAPSDKIIMLEPRRLAARAAAQRIASLMGEEVGGFVGFRTRLESAVSDRTRIEVLTEGLFLRRLLGDPMLEGVACVILDEIHERSLDADLALAFCLDLQRTLRPDLRLVAMSATAETERLAALMNAPVLTSEGRMFPLTVHHAKHDIPSLRDIATATATGVRQALAETEGDILTFLPGTGEIRRVMQLLENVPATVLPLHGELHPAEQARVLRPGNEGERRVILATSIAETSLTVPGVRVVVDCGFRRVPRFDAGAGLSRLDTVRISKAAARQRAGRAGREAPGMAYCLWSAHTERALPQHDRPEILEADLSDFVLATALWADTVGSADTPLPLPDQPPGSAVAAAKELLILLGALDDAGKITKLGRSMANLGTHPRLAAMILAARTAEEAALAADLAALLEERDPLRPRAAGRGGPPPIPPADITLRLDLIAGEDNNPQADRGALARIRQAAARFRTRMGLKPRHPAAGDAAALLAAGFPDRVALCRGDMGSYRMANGSNARLRRDDGLAKHKLLAVAGLHLRTAAEIRMAAPLDSNALPPALLERTREQIETTLDPVSGNIMARRRTRIGCLVLRDRTEKVKPEDAGPLLLAQAKEAPETTLNWSDAVRQLQARVELARTLPGGTGMEEAWPDFSSTALAGCMDEWLTPYVEGCTSITALRELDILNLLRTYLGYARTNWLDKELPTSLPFPGGVAEVDYTQPVPVASARAQAFYGTAETPKLAGGRVPLRLALLSPAGRPQAITADLAGFWQGGWADMRRDMRGRYPKHEWPENPALAPARPRAKRN